MISPPWGVSAAVLLVAAASVVGFAAAVTQERAWPPRKIFISVDMEGVAGVIQPSQLGPAGFEYGLAREWTTGEVNAAIEAARVAGATEFVVADSHGNAQNLLIDKLPEDVRIVRGFPRPLGMMQGIDRTFDAVIFIGFHASEWSVEAVRSHTMSSARLLGIRLNGVEVMEAVFNAAIAGYHDVPVIAVSGDRAAVTQAQRTLPDVEGAILKDAYGYHSASTVTPARARQMIRDAVTRAMKKPRRPQPYAVKTPIDLEVGFKATIDAERAAYIPGLTRVDAHTVKGTFADIVQVSRLLEILTSLEPPS
jgi:D-amino peptidase